MKRNPALIIGLVVTILVGALEQIAGSGIVNGNGLVLVNDLVSALPFIGTLLIHQLVTPVASPVLPINTPVTTPNGGTAVVTSTP